jgi:plasmid replication initiation protein
MMDSFECQYSARVYKLLKQYLRIGKRVIEIEDFKEKL